MVALNYNVVNKEVDLSNDITSFWRAFRRME